MTAPPRSPIFSHRTVVIAILILGAAASIFAYRQSRIEEIAEAGSVFAGRAALRHVLIREILGRFEDALFGLSALFVHEAQITRDDFSRAASRLEGRID